MAQNSEFFHRTQMSLINISDKVDKVLSAVNVVEARITVVEEKVNNFGSVHSGTPNLPPKSPQLRESAFYEDVRVYDKVGEATPPLPYRKRGKTFSKQQLEYLEAELVEVKEYVDATHTRNIEEKVKIQGSLKSLIATLHPPAALS